MVDSSATRIAYEVSGHVQGVGFRRFVEREASRIGITMGWVYNTGESHLSAASMAEILHMLAILAHGSVKGEAQSHDPKQIELFVDSLRKGTRYSRVDKVDFTKIDPVHHENEFTIKHK
ncbi:uncharacterized protein V1518DRAFT_425757 [Limtongia smithiae]|uniref:uncharacterized protein n=1 Tax=Limtongia smithiae TaxID=1125753 RepID=UPI0034CF25CA